ncbi:MAG: pyrroline-5-carboxylate reductase [Pseudomonadota bacterium]
MKVDPSYMLLVGCGAMGSALLRGWGATAFDHVSIVTPHRPSPEKLPADLNYTWHSSIEDVRAVPDLIVFAVKPQVLPEILPHYKQFVSQDTLFVSVIAGQAMQVYQDALGPEVALIRCMPNLPVALQKGMIVAMDSTYVSSFQREWIQILLQILGCVAWIDDEKLFAVVTAISGSGPAYFYLMVDALAQAGHMADLPRELADLLARQTLIGAGAQLESSDKSALQLKQAVTSPQGVTAAALEILEKEDEGLPDMAHRAITKAVRRAIELGQ